MSEIAILIEQLMTADNSVRSAAEVKYQSLKIQNPEGLTLSLQNVIEQSSIPLHFRQLSAVLLRQLLIDEPESFYGKLQPQSKISLKLSLLKSLDQETDLNMKARICDIVGELVGFVLEETEWPEILPYIYGNFQSPDPLKRETGLTLLGMISNSMTPILISTGNFPSLLSIFQSSLIDNQSSGRVNLAAIRALSSLLSCISLESQLMQFQPLIEPIFTGLNITCQTNHQGSSISSTIPCAYLEALIDISEEKSSLFGQQLLSVLTVLLTHLEDSEHTPSSLRHLIIEFLVCLCSGIPKVVRKLKSPQREEHFFPLRVFHVCSRMMASISEDPKWEIIESDEQDCNESGLDSEVAESALDRMSRSLGLRATLAIVSGNIQQLLRSSHWKEQHAGLRYLGNYLEMTAKIPDRNQLIQHRNEVISTLCSFACNPHPRVRGAAFYSISNFFLFHGGHTIPVTSGSLSSSNSLSDDHIDKLLGVIIQNSSVSINPAPRVRRYVLLALIHMIDSLSPTQLTPRLSVILSSVVQALSEGPQFVQETALLGIISLTETLQGEQIAAYYDLLMPILKDLLQVSQFRGNTSLWGLVLSCCAALGEASGKEKFTRDAMDMMAGLVSVQQQYQQYLDRVGSEGGGGGGGGGGGRGKGGSGAGLFIENMEDAKKYLMKTWVRIARCLGVEFVPFLQPVMEKLIASVSQDVTLPGSLSTKEGSYGFGGNCEDENEEDEEEDDDDEDDDEIQMVEGDQGWFKARTSLVEEVAASMQLILLIAERLQEHFYPFVEVTVRTITPLLQSPFEDIRSYAIVLIPELVRSTAKYNCQDPSRTSLIALSQFVLGQLVQTVQTDAHLELIMTGLQALKQVLIYSCTNWLELMSTRTPEQGMDDPPPITADTSLRILNPAQMEALTVCAKEVLKDSIQRRAVMRAEAKLSYIENGGGGDVDEDDRMEEEDFMKESLELHYNISEIVGTIFKTHGSDYMSIFETHWHEIIMQMTLPYCLKEDRQFAAFIISDVIEFGLDETHATRYMDAVLPTLFDICSAKTGLENNSSSSDPPPHGDESGIDLSSIQDPGPRQAACYAIGKAAMKHPQLFVSKFALLALQSLITCITLGECRSNDLESDEPDDLEQEEESTSRTSSNAVASRGPCIDNAVSAVGAILEIMESLGGRGVVSGSLTYSFLWGQWLNYLPIRHDVEEGYLVIQRLLRLLSTPPTQTALLSSSPEGAARGEVNDERLAQALEILVKIIDTRLTNPKLNVEIFTFLHSIRPDPSTEGTESSKGRLTQKQFSQILEYFPSRFRSKFEIILHYTPHLPTHWNGKVFFREFEQRFSLQSGGERGESHDSSPGPSAPIHDILFRK